VSTSQRRQTITIQTHHNDDGRRGKGFWQGRQPHEPDADVAGRIILVNLQLLINIASTAICHIVWHYVNDHGCTGQSFALFSWGKAWLCSVLEELLLLLLLQIRTPPHLGRCLAAATAAASAIFMHLCTNSATPNVTCYVHMCCFMVYLPLVV
jgi:hypothetical protein